MSLFLNTNIAALNAQRMLSVANQGLNTSMQRLASGLRINSAADDAAGLQISMRLTSQIQGLNQGMRNANDGISVAQVAEGALQESTGILQRMRMLAIQSQNGINASQDRSALQKEVAALSEELNRIAETTEFAGTKLLNGKYSADFLVGANAGQTIKLDLSERGFDMESLGIGDLSISDPANAAAALEKLDQAIAAIGDSRASLGATQNQFQSRIRSLSITSEQLSGARSRILDTDYAKETADFARWQIMQQASIAMLAQAQKQPEMILRLLG